jgi:hypothetical protein
LQVLPFQILHGFDEVALARGHDHVDRVEVFPAFKASGQVGCGVGGGMQAAAARAAEPQPTAAAVYFQLQPLYNQVADGDLVAQGAQQGRWIVASHQWHRPIGGDRPCSNTKDQGRIGY